jgi:hypothetical protein
MKSLIVLMDMLSQQVHLGGVAITTHQSHTTDVVTVGGYEVVDGFRGKLVPNVLP